MISSASPSRRDRPGPLEAERRGVEALARAEPEDEPSGRELAQRRRGLGDRGRVAAVGVGDRDAHPGPAGRHQGDGRGDERVGVGVRVRDDLGQHSPGLPPERPGVPGHEVVRVPERVDALGLGQHRRTGRDRRRAVGKAHGADLDHGVFQANPPPCGTLGTSTVPRPRRRRRWLDIGGPHVKMEQVSFLGAPVRAPRGKRRSRSMEFGLFMGGFVHKDQMAADPDAEHWRLMSEVALAEVGDRSQLEVLVVDRAPLPLGVLPHLGERDDHAVRRRAHEADAHRLRDHQHHSPGEPPGARRRARRDARPPLRGPVRVRHRPRLVHHRAGRLRDQRPRPHQGHVRRGDRRVQEDVGARAPTSTTASSSRMPERNVLPEALREAAPADVGGRRATRARSRRRGRWASASSASPAARPRRWRR